MNWYVTTIAKLYVKLQKLLFSDDGEIFQLWERPPVDLYLKVYLFNITNAEEFMAGRDKKLNVEEIGPYVYR
jgi:scavenger receptor class B, member 1